MQSLWMQCRMFEAISFTANEKKNDSNNKRKARTKNDNEKPSEVTKQRQRNDTIVCTHRIGAYTNTHTKKKENDEKKNPKTELRGVNSYHLRDNYFIVCTPVCVYFKCGTTCLFIAHCNYIASHFILHFSQCFFFVVVFVSSAQLPSLLLPRIPHTNTYIACILYSIHFCLWFLF